MMCTGEGALYFMDEPEIMRQSGKLRIFKFLPAVGPDQFTKR